MCLIIFEIDRRIVSVIGYGGTLLTHVSTFITLWQPHFRPVSRSVSADIYFLQVFLQHFYVFTMAINEIRINFFRSYKFDLFWAYLWRKRSSLFLILNIMFFNALALSWDSYLFYVIWSHFLLIDFLIFILNDLAFDIFAPREKISFSFIVPSKSISIFQISLIFRIYLFDDRIN